VRNVTSLVELRVLEGPNLYFPRAAIKLTLDLGSLASASNATAKRFADRIGLRNARPGEPETGFRQRFAARAVARLVRAVAAESGTSRLAVRVRPTSDPQRLVVAFPWWHRERAQVMGRAVADVLDSLPQGDVDAAVGEAAARVGAADLGEGPRTITPRVPVVAVTGTNGKTTTSRLIAHLARTHGLLVGWSSTDGIYVDGELVEAGDYSGPSGAGRVLAHEKVELAVTETARGGILLKGIGGHQRHRRPPGAARHRHPRPAGRGQGGRPTDHPQGRLGGVERRRPAGVRDAGRHQGRRLGVLARPGLAGHP
jgi:cyanophycin synthetase